MILPRWNTILQQNRIPRESGDDPTAGRALYYVAKYSPRERG